MRYLLFLFLVTSAFAQQRKVSLRLLAFDGSKVPQESYFFDPAAPEPAAGLPAPVKNYLNHERLNLNLFGNDMVFSSSLKVADARNADLQLGKVTLPTTSSEFLLVFLPGEGTKYHVMAVDDSVKGFPLGGYRVLNLSRFPIKLTLEDKPYDFKPGQGSVITDPPLQANNHSAMYAFSQVDGKWQRIGSGLWPSPGKKRSIQIFFDNPTSGNTELRGFKDISPPIPKPAAQAVAP